jgi:hypothetical protein
MNNFKNIWNRSCSKYNILEQPSIIPAVNRIIVIGDIHGDIEMTVRTLKVAKLIKKEFNSVKSLTLVNRVLNENLQIWDGGDTVVVQVGDQVDRCRLKDIPCDNPLATHNDEGNDWKILQFFTILHQQAQKVGGAIYSLMGNHELMNVMGDLRYVSHEGLKEFDDYTKPDGEKFVNGHEARKWAFQPGNPVSEFLACTRQMSIIIGSNLFVHAGIVPKIAKKYKIENLNKLMSLYLLNKLTNSEDYADIFINSETSPLWNRVYGSMGLEEQDHECENLLKPLETIYNVDKIFVGHTPIMKKGISSVCNDKVWLTDYGASKAFDKFDDEYNNVDKRHKTKYRSTVRNAHVLEIKNDSQMRIIK